MRTIIAVFFRQLFKIKYLKATYFGFYKKIFEPFNLFKGVTVKVLYRTQIKLNLHIDDWIQQNLYFLNEYEEKEIKFVEKYLKKDDVFIDVGANIGLYSLVAAKQIEGGKVYAFEPIKKNSDSLLYNIKLNKPINIIVEKLAVSDNEKNLILYLDENEKNNGMATAYADTFTYNETVPCTSLDFYFANKDISAVKLIKIDIEGGEYNAVIGMQNILKKYKPTLLIEINPDAPYDENILESLLFEMGYKKYYLDERSSPINTKLAGDNSCNYLFSCDSKI